MAAHFGLLSRKIAVRKRTPSLKLIPVPIVLTIKAICRTGQCNQPECAQEYYLTDCIGILKQAGETVLAYQTDDYAESIGVNDRLALSEAEGFMRERINRTHMLNGVTIIDPSSTYIGADVKIGSDTVLYPGTVLKGNTVIGEDCVIGPDTDIEDSVIADGASVKHSVLSSAEVGSRTSVGPYAYLRPGAKLGTM